MKIGILTFWESHENYGQLLQVYALQEYLKKHGHEPFVIKFHRRPPTVPKKSLPYRLLHFNPVNFLLSKWKKQVLKKQIVQRGFDGFRETKLTFGPQSYASLAELKASPPVADAYICGSDQVWNNSFAVPCEPFLLGFGANRIRRVAYAASFGQTNLNEETAELFSKYLPDFDAVGVREKGGLKLCRDAGYPDAVWVPDPTLLFSKNEWAGLLQLPDVQPSKSRNVFIYTLGNSAIQNREEYLSFAKSLPNSNYHHVTANMEAGGNSFPAIPDWVSLIRSADFVVTNSFHGMVFCIIFHRRFVVLPNTGKVTGMNDRISSLLEKLGLEDHLSAHFDAAHLKALTEKDVDWVHVDDILTNWKQDADRLLMHALSPSKTDLENV